MSPAPEVPDCGVVACSDDDMNPGTFADELWTRGHDRLAQVVEAVMQARQPHWLLLPQAEQALLAAGSPRDWGRVQEWLWWSGHHRARLIDAPIPGSEADTVTVAFAPGVPPIPERLRPAYPALLVVAERDGRLKPRFQPAYGHLIELEPETLVPRSWRHAGRGGRPLTAIQRIADFRLVLHVVTRGLPIGWIHPPTLEAMLADEKPGAERMVGEMLEALVKLHGPPWRASG